jgi:hypothetical protein
MDTISNDTKPVLNVINDKLAINNKISQLTIVHDIPSEYFPGIESKFHEHVADIKSFSDLAQLQDIEFSSYIRIFDESSVDIITAIITKNGTAIVLGMVSKRSSSDHSRFNIHKFINEYYENMRALSVIHREKHTVYITSTSPTGGTRQYDDLLYAYSSKIVNPALSAIDMDRCIVNNIYSISTGHLRFYQEFPFNLLEKSEFIKELKEITMDINDLYGIALSYFLMTTIISDYKSNLKLKELNGVLKHASKEKRNLVNTILLDTDNTNKRLKTENINSINNKIFIQTAGSFNPRDDLKWIDYFATDNDSIIDSKNPLLQFKHKYKDAWNKITESLNLFENKNNTVKLLIIEEGNRFYYKNIEDIQSINGVVAEQLSEIRVKYANDQRSYRRSVLLLRKDIVFYTTI